MIEKECLNYVFFILYANRIDSNKNCETQAIELCAYGVTPATFNIYNTGKNIKLFISAYSISFFLNKTKNA